MHLTLHLTKSCNLRCRYCYAPPQAGGRMSERIGRAAMDMGRRMNRSSCGVVFFGGEPLLEKDLLVSLVDYGRGVRERHEGLHHFKITTNGLLLDDEFLDFAVRNEVMIAMSFDGVREAHDAHRIRPDGSSCFDLAVDRLKLLLAYRPYSSVIMVVNPDTAHRMAESVEFTFGLGVRYLILALNYAGDWREEHFETLRRQYERLGRLYIRWTRAGRKFYFSPFEVKLSSHINRHCFHREQCDLGNRQISVDPEGWLFPCVQFVKAGPQSRWCIGNVFDGLNADAKAILNEEARREKEACRNCDLRDRCGQTCACLNWQTTESITEVSPILCRHERLLTPIVDRTGNLLYRRREPLFIQKHYNPAYPALSLVEDAMDPAVL